MQGKTKARTTYLTQGFVFMTIRMPDGNVRAEAGAHSGLRSCRSTDTCQPGRVRRATRRCSGAQRGLRYSATEHSKATQPWSAYCDGSEQPQICRRPLLFWHATSMAKKSKPIKVGTTSDHRNWYSTCPSMSTTRSVMTTSATSPSAAALSRLAVTSCHIRANHDTANALTVIGHYRKRTTCSMRALMILLLLSVLATPSFAATYWIVAKPYQGCSIVEQDQAPVLTGGAKLVGNGYSSEQDAQSAMQHAIACGGIH